MHTSAYIPAQAKCSLYSTGVPHAKKAPPLFWEFGRGSTGKSEVFLYRSWAIMARCYRAACSPERSHRVSNARF